ncbi:MAG: hypothetical protein SFT94_12100 [Pseudanabaenaceae cyanobacterium bins.68]|nr:hypothetical protein [Pseudanabaenaceae cyanobacterium bins.68]
MLKVGDVARYYRGLPHQIQALGLLDQELWANYPERAMCSQAIALLLIRPRIYSERI